MIEPRFSRHDQLFGEAGQDLIGRTKYAIVGLGGTGSHVAQQLAYLGGKDFRLVDGDRLDATSMNRVVTACPDDIAEGRLKVDAAERSIRTIQAAATVVRVPTSFVTRDGFAAVQSSDVVFGCVDNDAARLILNELCQAFCVTYIDIATDVPGGNARDFGGRVHLSVKGERCLICDDLLDQDAIRRSFETTEQRHEDERIYGVPRAVLGSTGPSVVALNGLLASVALIEFMAHLTQIRKPNAYLEYRGSFGVLTRKDEPRKLDCYYCKGSSVRGRGPGANVDRFIRN